MENVQIRLDTIENLIVKERAIYRGRKVLSIKRESLKFSGQMLVQTFGNSRKMWIDMGEIQEIKEVQ